MIAVVSLNYIIFILLLNTVQFGITVHVCPFICVLVQATEHSFHNNSIKPLSINSELNTVNVESQLGILVIFFFAKSMFFRWENKTRIH